MDDLAIQVEAQREFMLETLAKFRMELNEMKEKIERQDSNLKRCDEEINALSANYRRMSGPFAIKPVSPACKCKYFDSDGEEEEEEAEKDTEKLKVKVPTTIDDVCEALQRRLSHYYTSLNYLGDKEKVTKIQLAFIHYWLSNIKSGSPTKMEDIKHLLEEGIRQGLWTRGWKPNIRGEFAAYLQEKVKNIVKRKRIMEEKETLRKDLEECGAYGDKPLDA